MRIRKWLGLPIVAALVASVVMTVGVAAQDATPEVSEQPSFPVTVTFLNAMTAQKNVDVYVNGSDSDERVVEGLDYGTFSAPFEGTAPATTVVIKQNVNLAFDRWLFNAIVPTEAGRQYVIIISDYVLIPLQVNTSAMAGGGASARIAHAAAQAPAVDVLVDGTVAVENLQYGRASDEAGELAAGDYAISLNATGTDTEALDGGTLTLQDAKAYVFVIIGEPESSEEPLEIVTYETDIVVG